MTTSLAPEKLAYSITEAVAAVGVSKDTLQRAINAGHLRVKRTSVNEHGEPTGLRLVLKDDLQAWLDGLVDG